jgi:hypothetical protein
MVTSCSDFVWMRMVEHFVCASPGRQRGAFVDRPRSAPPPAPGAGKDPMVDALAEREEHEEALCAVRVPLHPVALHALKMPLCMCCSHVGEVLVRTLLHCLLGAFHGVLLLSMCGPQHVQCAGVRRRPQRAAQRDRVLRALRRGRAPGVLRGAEHP